MPDLPIPKPIKRHRPKRTVRASVPERDLQGMAEELCDVLGVRFFRIPDKLLGYLRGSAPPAVRFFVYRYLSGIPDMMLFKALPEGRNEVMFLEIKTESGRLSLNQRKWMVGLNVKVAYGWNEVRDAIMGFAGG